VPAGTVERSVAEPAGLRLSLGLDGVGVVPHIAERADSGNYRHRAGLREFLQHNAALSFY